MHDRSEWGGYCEGECMGHTPVDEPLLYEAIEEWSIQPKGIKGKYSLF